MQSTPYDRRPLASCLADEGGAAEVPSRPRVARLLCIALLLVLTACGGGDPEPEQQLPGPPDCQNHPERCT